MLSFLIISLFVVTQSYVFGEELNNRKFPSDFMFGSATSAYQVEGAWNEGGRGVTVWDTLCHAVPSMIFNGDTGDIASDTYHKFKDDIQLMKDLGLNHYRFSIAWSRIYPDGYNHGLNQAGVNYYTELIRELKSNNIEPLVTLFHWDTPQALQNIGGWPNDLIVDYFAEYARTCFKLFGKEVKYWTTFNEPKQTCYYGYTGLFPPSINARGIGEYLCTHNVIKAHAKVWHMYQDEFKKYQGGKVGIVIDSNWFEPDSDQEDDVNAAERQRHFTFGWFANPVIYGDYPEVMKEYISKRSSAEGFPKSRLPSFTKDESDYIKGTADYLGVNFYTSQLVKHKDDPEVGTLGWEFDSETVLYQKPEWESSASDWLKVTPWNIRKHLNWIHNTYGDIPLIITENGVSDNGTSLEDDQRIKYYQEHLSYVRYAMEDGVNIFGFTAWSLMDNFEWLYGYSQKFGLYHVDFNSPNRTRTPKKSVSYYQQVTRTRCILDDPEQCIE